MTPTRLELALRLVEDLHSGTGMGGGDVDVFQARDRHGRPVIRATHIRGLLLLAAEELVALDAVGKSEVEQLFGQRGGSRAALRLTSARLYGDCRGETLLWTSTARAAGDRRPEPDSMRVIEHVAAGNTFVAQIRVPAVDGSNLTDLIRRLALRLDRIGSDRTRGGGLVETELHEVTAGAARRCAVTGSTVRLALRNVEPLCLPDVGYPGNLVTSLPFIRGQALRGALMNWALARDDKDAVRVLGSASVGDALPLPAQMDGARLDEITVMPIPLSVMTPKPAGIVGSAPWWSYEGTSSAPGSDELGADGRSSERPKRPGAREYLARSRDDGWVRYTPLIRVHMRNATTDLPERDLSGTPNKEPQLFSVEEIAEDTHFVADIRFDDANAAQQFLRCFEPVVACGEWLAVGRGGQPVEVVDAADAPATERRVDGDDWTLTLVSDTVMRGKRLGFLSNLDLPQLCRLAGVGQRTDWTIRCQAETTVLHGFNAVTGLRRRAAVAIRRGSCWRVSGPGSQELGQVLAKLDSLGERTDEGCGRFVMGTQPIRRIRVSDRRAIPIASNRKEELLAAARELAKAWEKEAFMKAMTPSAAAGEEGPSLSQLQWLRARALAARDRQAMNRLLDEIEAARKRQHGAPWKAFPLEKVRAEVERLETTEECRTLVASIVQWMTLQARQRLQRRQEGET